MSKAKNILTGLDDRIVIRGTVLDDDNVVHLYIDMPESQRICPDCGSEICWICDSGRDIEVHHLPMVRKPCVIHTHLHHSGLREISVNLLTSSVFHPHFPMFFIFSRCPVFLLIFPVLSYPHRCFFKFFSFCRCSGILYNSEPNAPCPGLSPVLSLPCN